MNIGSTETIRQIGARMVEEDVVEAAICEARQTEFEIEWFAKTRQQCYCTFQVPIRPDHLFWPKEALF